MSSLPPDQPWPPGSGPSIPPPSIPPPSVPPPSAPPPSGPPPGPGAVPNSGVPFPPPGPGGGSPAAKGRGRGPLIAVSLVAVVAIGAAVFGFLQDPSADKAADLEAQLAELEADIADTEGDARKQLEDVEEELTAAEDEVAALRGGLPATVDDIAGSDVSGTWNVVATFSNCDGVAGGVDACRDIGGGKLEFPLTIGFEDGTFTAASDELASVDITRDTSYTYLLEADPGDSVAFPAFSCNGTPSPGVVSMDLRTTTATIISTGWLSVEMTGTLVFTSTPTSPECVESVIRYDAVLTGA